MPINDTPRLSQEEELMQDYRSGTTIVMEEEHHHTGLFPTGHRYPITVMQLKKSRVFELTKAKARWFYSSYPDLLVVFGELVMVFGKLKGVFEEKNKFLTISILNLRIICEYLKLGVA